MNKQSYYEILEVDKNASPEVIKKAYNTLAKKYHPDLKQDQLKSVYEEKLKLINEAYAVLSDKEARENYDQTFVSELDALRQRLDELTEENARLRKKFEESYVSHPTVREAYQKAQFNKAMNDAMNEAVNEARNQAYYDAYMQDMQNRGYEVEPERSSPSTFKNVFAIFLTLLILYLLWQIPFIRSFVINLLHFN